MDPEAYETMVLELVSRRTGIPVSRISLQDRLLQDLGIDGDDAAELLTELADAFGVDMSTLEIGRHFRPEPDFISVLRLPSVKKRELQEKVPISVRDLVRAAETRTWPHDC